MLCCHMICSTSNCLLMSMAVLCCQMWSGGLHSSAGVTVSPGMVHTSYLARLMGNNCLLRPLVKSRLKVKHKVEEQSVWITLPEQNTVSWEEKTPGREIHDIMLYKIGSQGVNRLCYLCLQHKLLECVHDSKKDVAKWKSGTEKLT